MEVSALPRGLSLVPRSRRLLGAFSDARLVHEVRRGNDVAFEVVFDRHHRAILTFARHMLASADEAEDVVQHTFAQAYYSLQRSDSEIQLRPWLYAIARNRCLSLLRARREQPGELDDIPTVGLSESVQQRADLRDMLRDMRELPEDQRAALVLSQLGDLSHAQIADVLGCDPMKVKSLVFQARSALIDSRLARETPCDEIREQLATLRGGALRRTTLNKHVRICPGCAEFRHQLRGQRQMLALALPVVPSVGLKTSALGALGLSGGSAATAGAAGGGAGGGSAAAGGGAAGGGVASGGIASALGSASAVKVAAVVVAASAAIGGGVALTHHAGGHAARYAPPVASKVRTQRAATPAGHHAGPRTAGQWPGAASRWQRPAGAAHRHSHLHRLGPARPRAAGRHSAQQAARRGRGERSTLGRPARRTHHPAHARGARHRRGG